MVVPSVRADSLHVVEMRVIDLPVETDGDIQRSIARAAIGPHPEKLPFPGESHLAFSLKLARPQRLDKRNDLFSQLPGFWLTAEVPGHLVVGYHRGSTL